MLEQMVTIVYRKAEENFSIVRKGYAWPQLDPKLMTVVADRVFGAEFAGMAFGIRQVLGPGGLRSIHESEVYDYR